jgi:hypothetical protein
MKIRGFNDHETGWAFTCQVQDNDPNRTVEGGLVLNNVTHQGHRFADEIRVIGFWLEWEEKRYAQGTQIAEPILESRVLKSKFYTLSSDYFDISEIQVLRPAESKTSPWGLEWETFRKSDSALGFGHFPFYFGLEVKYTSKADIFDGIPNFDKKGLEIRQTHMFSKYSSMPPHEPTGGLTAARLHPMMTLEWINSQLLGQHDVRKSILKSLRFDYLFRPNLDGHYDLSVNRTLARLGNHAGIFKDEEKPNFIRALEAVNQGIRPASGVVFSAVEKPIVLEICAKGLLNGTHKFLFDGKSVLGWDNIHIWGARQGVYPTSPGSFHCLHLHWRWGPAVSGAKFGQEPQFNIGGFAKVWEANGLSKIGKIGNGIALVDPYVWNQTIFFAIVKNGRGTSGALPQTVGEFISLTDEKFEKQFIKNKSEGPAIISDNPVAHGEELLLWFSIKVSREKIIESIITNDDGEHTITSKNEISSMNGAIFVHGIFFPHEAEGKSKEVGSKLPLYWPTKREQILLKRQWERY